MTFALFTEPIRVQVSEGDRWDPYVAIGAEWKEEKYLLIDPGGNTRVAAWDDVRFDWRYDAARDKWDDLISAEK